MGNNDRLPGSIVQADAKKYLSDLPEGVADMILTDPPYGIAFKSNMGEEGFRKDAIANDGFDDWLHNLPSWLRAMKRALKDGGTLAMFCGVTGGPMGKQVAPLHHAMREVESVFGYLAKVLVWDRCDMGMGSLGGHYRPVWEAILVTYKGEGPSTWNGGANTTDILRCPRIIPKAGDHPTPKPIPVLGDLIETHTNAGDLIIDPFCGSGSTFEAAELLKRRWMGCDLEEKYVRMAQERLDAFRRQPQMF